MAKAKPVVLKTERLRRCFVCNVPDLPEWIHESLVVTLGAEKPKPSVRTVRTAAASQAEFVERMKEITEDNVREHLHRHEPTWGSWDEL